MSVIRGGNIIGLYEKVSGILRIFVIKRGWRSESHGEGIKQEAPKPVAQSMDNLHAGRLKDHCYINRGFPKLGLPLWGGGVLLTIRILAFGGCWGPSASGNYYIAAPP